MDDVLTDYRAAIDALFARTTNNMKFGLERTEALLELLGNPHRRLTALHIAGTNGKGSVVATCDALLRANGKRVGRYTSPHLIDFRERISIDGVPISERQVLEFLERMTPDAERMGATFFELTTALAFDWFAREGVDIAVIETGLGGRLDSTNVITPIVATVTSIGLDHMDLLGNTLESIAREKAGIFKRGVPAVIGERDPAIRRLLGQCAADVGASPIMFVSEEYPVSDIAISRGGTSFVFPFMGTSVKVVTPLIGAFQAHNTSVAIATLAAARPDLLPSSKSWERALKNLFLPGRFQRHALFIFDVAHNPAGARVLADNLRAVNVPRPLTALVAVLSDKDWRGVISELSTVVDRFVFTNAPSAPSARLWDANAAAEFARSLNVDARAVVDIDDALDDVQRGASCVLVTGSFHTVGDVMSRLQVSPFAA
ncbi:MAG TPA: folylpolyglutamate synthase/dihydrofolate synthase family protein [Gemmatimonadaceae bacterium]